MADRGLFEALADGMDLLRRRSIRFGFEQSGGFLANFLGSLSGGGNRLLIALSCQHLVAELVGFSDQADWR